MIDKLEHLREVANYKPFGDFEGNLADTAEWAIAEIQRLREINRRLVGALKKCTDEFKHLGQALGELTTPEMVDIWNAVDDTLAFAKEKPR